MAVRVIQLNCQRTYTVWDDFAREAMQREVEIVAVQEPPGMAAGTISRLPGMVPVVPVGGPPKVGIHVRADLVVQRLDSPPHDWYVLAVVRIADVDLVMGSLYLAPSEGILEKLDILGSVVRNCRQDKLLICADANARAREWHSGVTGWQSRGTDPSGRAIGGFLDRWDLHVVNRPSHLTTFCDTRGRGSNIDVTICNLHLVPHIRGWEVENCRSVTTGRFRSPSVIH